MQDPREQWNTEKIDVNPRNWGRDEDENFRFPVDDEQIEDEDFRDSHYEGDM